MATNSRDKPTKEDFNKFIDAFEKLASFEAFSRENRGQGCFDENDLPIPEVVKVLGWLNEELE